MTDLSLAIAAVGGLVLVIGLFSKVLKARTCVTPPLLSLAAGVAPGPVALGWRDPARWGSTEGLLAEGARRSLAIGLMTVALRLPPRYGLQHRRTLTVFIGLVMPLMWRSAATLIHLGLGLPFTLALLVGAVVTTTGPIAATSIVTGPTAERRIPERIRHLISAESGLNDGLAYPLVVLAVIALGAAPLEGLPRWLARTVLWEVGAGVAFGAILSLVAGVLGVLLLRRLPALAAVCALIPELRGTRDVLFVGWFGPMGASAVLLAMLALRSTGHEQPWTHRQPADRRLRRRARRHRHADDVPVSRPRAARPGRALTVSFGCSSA